MDVARDIWAGVIKKGLWALSLIAFAMDDRTQRVADEIASIEAISHNTVKALSTVTTPLKGSESLTNHSSLTHHVYETIKRRQEGRNAAGCSQQGIRWRNCRDLEVEDYFYPELAVEGWYGRVWGLRYPAHQAGEGI